jgi:ribosomal protein S19E (S16A)
MMSKKTINYMDKAHEVRTEWSNESLAVWNIAPTASQLLRRVEAQIDMDEILLKILSGKKVTIDGKKIMDKIKGEVWEEAGITEDNQ